MPTKKRRTQPKRLPLTRERVIDVAFALAGREGVDAITMRRLGQKLGVEAMSLYKHVADKDEILDAVVERVFDQIVVPSPEDDWRSAMRLRARSARDAFLRHPWAVALLESRWRRSGPRRLGYYDAILGALRRAGFSSQLAMRGFSVVDAYIYGYIQQERSLASDHDSLSVVDADIMQQMPDRFPHLSAVTRHVLAAGYDRAVEFGYGLDLILDALEQRRIADQKG